MANTGNNNPGSSSNDKQKASDAGQKGGQANTGTQRDQQSTQQPQRDQGQKGGQGNAGNNQAGNDRDKQSQTGQKGGQSGRTDRT